MTKLSKEKYIEIFGSLPENVQDALFSLETADIIHEVGLKNKLNDASISTLTELVGDLLMGLVGEIDFQKKIEAEIAVNSVSSNIIAKELINRIVTPLKEESAKNVEPLKPAFITEDKKEENKNVQPSPVTNRISTPPPQEALAFEDKHETPFILHQEEEIKPGAEPEIQPSIPRPTFYKPAFREEYNGEAAPVTARLELGNEEEEKSKEPQTVRTEKPQVRIVHYSDLRTSVSPFGSAGSAENAIPKVESREEDSGQFSVPMAKPQNIRESEKIEVSLHPNNVINLKKENDNEDSIKPDVHPDNVINLKDLPL